MLARALRRRCPRCGDHAFETFFAMKAHCRRCGLEFEREPGYWVGAMIINTTATFATFLAVFGGAILLTWPEVPWVWVLLVTAVTNLVIPILFYPISKTLWAALELSWHPLEAEELSAASARAADNGFR